MKLVCGIIVTYNPGHALDAAVRATIMQVDHIVIVDNGSKEETFSIADGLLKEFPLRLSLIKNTFNMGLASALNQGARFALDRGFDWLLTLDQDSIPAQNMIECMLSVYPGLHDKECVAILAPMLEDRSTGLKASFLKFGVKFHLGCDNREYVEPDLVITSGSLMRSAAFMQIGFFEEKLFIDCVDYDYCLRLKEKGFRIVAVCNALLYHSLGNMKRVRILRRDFYPTNHSAARWYYMSRNRVYLYSRHWRNLWFIYLDAVSFIQEIIKVMLFENFKAAKMSNICKGFIDGLARKF